MTNFFQLLPDEMHLQILRFLSAADLTKTARVSKDWNNLSNDRLLWIEVLKKVTLYAVKKGENPKQIYRELVELKKKTSDELFYIINNAATQAELIISTPRLLNIIDTSTLTKVLSPYLDNSVAESEWTYFLAYEASKTIVCTQALLEKVANNNVIFNKIITKGFHVKYFLNNLKLFEKLDQNDLYNLFFSFLANYTPDKEEVEIYLSEKKIQQKLGSSKLAKIFVEFPEYVILLQNNPIFLPLFAERQLYSIINASLDDAYKNIDSAKEDLRNCNSLKELLCYQLAEDEFVVASYLLLKLAQRTTELNEDKLMKIINLQKMFLFKINAFFIEDAKLFSLPATDAENLFSIFIKLFSDIQKNIETARELISTYEEDLASIKSYQTVEASYETISRLLLNLAQTNNKLNVNDLNEIFNQLLILLRTTNTLVNEFEERPTKYQKLA